MYGHAALTCTASLCGTPWCLLASLHWGLTLPQGRCGRWLLTSYQRRLQMEGAKMVGRAEWWNGQLMQEDNT